MMALSFNWLNRLGSQRGRLPVQCFQQAASHKPISKRTVSQRIYHSSSSQHQSSTATTQMVDDDYFDAQATTPNHSSRVVRPFDEIPVPGGKSTGIVGALSKTHHAWKYGAFKQSHLYSAHCFSELGPIYRQQLGDGSWMVMLCDPHDFEKLFRVIGKYPQRTQVETWKEIRRENELSYGVITDDGQRWHRMRGALSKGILRPAEVAGYVNTMHNVSLILVDKIRQIRQSQGQNKNLVKDLETELWKWAMESSCMVFFDRKLNLLTEKVLSTENKAFFNALTALTTKTLYLLMFPHKWHKRLRSPAYSGTRDAWHVLFHVSKKYVDQKMNQLTEKAAEGLDINDGSFLSYLMVQDKLTPDEIYGNMAELLPASVDTTSSSMIWCMYLLAKNPKVQERLHDEVIGRLPRGKAPTRQDIDSMPYLKAVVKETLRLYPVTLATARILDDDIVLKGYQIPPGVSINTSFYCASHDPDIFEDPESFKPERWLDTDNKPHPFASLPFGFGTRMCLGRRIAEQEMYLATCEISRNFFLENTKDVAARTRLVITPDQPVELKFMDRQ